MLWLLEPNYVCMYILLNLTRDECAVLYKYCISVGRKGRTEVSLRARARVLRYENRELYSEPNNVQTMSGRRHRRITARRLVRTGVYAEGFSIRLGQGLNVNTYVPILGLRHFLDSKRDDSAERAANRRPMSV